MGVRSDSRGKQSLSSSLGILWPGLRYLGLGVWLAWLFLAFSGTVWLSDVEIDGTNLSTMFLDVNVASAVTLLVAPFFKDFFDTLLERRIGVMCGALVATLGGTAVILAGPYYAGLPAVFLTGNILMGIGSGILALKCGRLYGELQPQRALLYALLSQVVLVLIFYFAVGNDFFTPIPGGPSLTGILSLTLLPLLAAYLVTIEPRSPARARAQGTNGGGQETQSEEGNSIRALPPVFWKFVFAIFVFTFAVSIAQGYYTTSRPPSATLTDTLYVMLCRIVFALGFILLVIRFLKNIALSKLYLLCTVLIAVAFAAAPLLNIDSTLFSSFIGFSYGVFDLLIWCLLTLVVFDKRISSTIVFGFGRGVFLAGSALGWLLGTRVLHTLAGTGGEMVFYIILAVFILLSTTLVFTEKDFDRLFALHEGAEVPLEPLLPFLSSESLAATDDDGTKRKNERPWLTACHHLGKRMRLSAREQDVLELLALGRGNENIAQRLGISLNTVRTHTQNVYAKLNVHSRQELVELVEAERDQLESN
ncbi:MAG: LuxR C-terminal-related transcriptional regulator [Coriobacteriales bacterium]|jgi:DNA-binding CsgD family transcriptional regulator|nr:LuxR C-terminal-related transcriptional regulator [Coriobacteriales bacterium]